MGQLDTGRTILGRYDIIDVIGKGGFGEVYKAKQHTTGQMVAVKILTANKGDESERFIRERQLLSEVKHPNIVQLIDSGQVDGHEVMVLEFVDGNELTERLQIRGPMSIHTTRRIMSQVLEALVVAHEKGVVHRDLKPANIMLTGPEERPVAKVLDFGIAGVTEVYGGDWSTLTATGMISGTPAYIAPELLVPESGKQIKASPQSDIYAMGLIVLECLTSVTAITGETPFELLMKHVQHPLDIPSEIRGGPFGSIIVRACAKRPEDRYASAGEMLAAVERVDPSGYAQTTAPIRQDIAFVTADTGVVSSELNEVLDSQEKLFVAGQGGSHQAPTVAWDASEAAKAPSAPSAHLEVPGRGRGLMIGATIVVLLLVGGGLAYSLMGGEQNAEKETSGTDEVVPADVPLDEPEPEPEIVSEPAAPDEAPIVLVLSSKPNGAEVYEGEVSETSEPVGTTPHELKSEEGGVERHFTFRLDGHKDMAKRVQVPPIQEGSQFKVPVHATLQPRKMVSWSLEPSPAGRVMLGSEVLCQTTPCVVERDSEEANNLTVSIEADGYRTTKVSLPAEGGTLSPSLRKRKSTKRDSGDNKVNNTESSDSGEDTKEGKKGGLKLQ